MMKKHIKAYLKNIGCDGLVSEAMSIDEPSCLVDFLGLGPREDFLEYAH